jgi:UDP-N-acetylglucosamine 2-epimerase (non-hydrolysing)
VILVTAHRRENLGKPLGNICRAIGALAAEYPDVEVIFPVHKNPAVRQVVEQELRGRARVHLIEPLDYQPFANLMNKAYLVLSDSGGLQEEAPALGKPVLVLRDTTERPEAVQAGTVRLIGTEQQRVFAAAKQLLDDPADYQQMAQKVNPYGDGLASRRILQGIRLKFGIADTPVEEFRPA